MAKDPEKQSTPNSVAARAASSAELADEIAKRINALVPAQQRSQVVAQVVSLVQEDRFAGPIAHPKHFREYEAILPGSGDRIIRMAECQIDHNFAMQSRALDADISDMREGRRLGFAALAILIVGAIVCGILEKDTIALALLGTGVIGTIGTLIRGRGRD